MPPLLPKKTFDDAKLVTMTPPFTVRIEKRKGHQRTPITLPAGEDGQEPGTGFEVEEVRKLESWIATEWTGGGMYEFTVTDSSATPVVMKWESWFDPKDFPERVSPLVAEAQAAAGYTPPPQPTAPTRSPMPGAFSSGFPNAASFQGFPQPQPQQMQGPYGYGYMPQPPRFESPAYPIYAAEAERRRHEDEIAKLREESARREREAQEAKHKAELERVRTERENETRTARYDAQLSELRNMIASLATTIKDGAGAKSDNAQVEALQRKLDAETAAREADRRDRETREMIKTMQENAQKQIELLQRQIEESARRAAEAASQNQYNPIIKMIEDQARQHAESIKEISRNSTSQIEKLQAMVMSPREMMTFAKEANSGVEQTTERMGKFFGSVIELQQKVTENMMSMQPQSNSVVDLVREGVQGLKETAERYVGAKSASERVQVQAQVQLAQAQAQSQQAQAEAMKAAASVELANRGVHVPPAPVPQIQIPAQASGLAGVKPQAPVVPINSKPKKNGKGKVAAPPESKIKRLGKTDIEWFGPLITQVQEARENVELFLKSCEAVRDAKDGEEPELEGASPEELAGFVVQATAAVMQAQLPIPALLDLLMQNRYADFVDVLIPNAPQKYRDDTVQSLIEQIRALTGEPVAEAGADGDADGDDGGDDDGDGDPDADDVKDGATAKPAKAGKPTHAQA